MRTKHVGHYKLCREENEKNERFFLKLELFVPQVPLCPPFKAKCLAKV